MGSSDRNELNDRISVDEKELHFEFIQSSGPGGQNVNKVASAVQLRFDVANSPSLSDEVRNRLLQIARNRISTDGILVIEAKRYRTQEQNRQDAIDRLNNLLRKAAEKPKPRKKTRPSPESVRRRLDEKRRRGSIKQLRRNEPDRLD